MVEINYSYETFVQNLLEIKKISDSINDNWQLINNSNDYCGSYLVKQFKSSIELVQTQQEPDKQLPKQDDLQIYSTINDFQDELSIEVDNSLAIVASTSKKTEMILYEYHVLYHQSYQIPYLCFNAYRTNGTKLTVHEAWQLFRRNTSHHQTISFTDENMLSILTEMDHPILFQPFLTLHPCRTAELLNSCPKSSNLILTFLSTIGPAINLSMDLRYGLSQNDNK